MKHVLVTGFEPFGKEKVNPSALAAAALDGRMVAGRRVTGVVLPCVFGKSLAILKHALRERQPELIICTGLAGGRKGFGVERVAINIEDADIPDNAGFQPTGRPVVRGGPAAYWSTLPVKAIVAALTEAKLPAGLSQTAGTYVCNHIFYGLMRSLTRKRGTRGGFIHLPYLRAQGSPSLSLKKIVRGLEIAIETSLKRS